MATGRPLGVLTDDRFRVAVLAGGRSTRMGRDKALIELDGRTLIRRVIDSAVAAGAESLVIVGGDDRLVSEVPTIADVIPGGGPAQAILAALRHQAEPDLVMVLPCDLLAPSSGAIRATVRALVYSTGAACAVPLSDGQTQWMHGCWRASIATPHLEQAIERGDRSIAACIDGLQLAIVGGVDPGALADADEPGDLPGHRQGDDQSHRRR